VKRMLLLLTVGAAVILLLAPTATAQYHTGARESMTSHTATATATEATSQPRHRCSHPLRKAGDPSLAASFTPVALILVHEQPCYQYLKKTGGPSLVALFALCALLVGVGSIVAMKSLLRRYTSP
jgi:hypothetical protein